MTMEDKIAKCVCQRQRASLTDKNAEDKFLRIGEYGTIKVLYKVEYLVLKPS